MTITDVNAAAQEAREWIVAPVGADGILNYRLDQLRRNGRWGGSRQLAWAMSTYCVGSTMSQFMAVFSASAAAATPPTTAILKILSLSHRS